jgi:hypothetical protein
MRNSIFLLLLVATFSFTTSPSLAQKSPLYEVYAIAFTNSFKIDGKWSATRNAPDSVEMCLFG